jgi:crotonobetainyl-CoA:carnitine CoA-transferase CaiB-like acyl-CoA transferase
MARFHATPNGLVPFTAEEEVYQDAQDAQNQIELAEQARTKYQRDRAAEYPSIGDQLDALFHAGVFPADMAAALQAVKNKYPKG